MDERAVARLQGQMCLFGIDTHTLIEWYNARISGEPTRTLPLLAACIGIANSKHRDAAGVNGH